MKLIELVVSPSPFKHALNVSSRGEMLGARIICVGTIAFIVDLVETSSYLSTDNVICIKMMDFLIEGHG